MHAHFQYLIPFSFHVHAKYENNISHRLIFMHTDKINKIYTIEKQRFSPQIHDFQIEK